MAETNKDSDEKQRCRRDSCQSNAEFWVYNKDQQRWHAFCRNHVVQLHPSLEVKAWLWSGYAKPIELDKPRRPPDDPVDERGEAFREMVDEAMNNA